MERVEVVAWVVVGTRKGASALRCAEHPVVLMLLGCEAAITLVPKGGFPVPVPLAVVAEADATLVGASHAVPRVRGDVLVKVEVVDDDMGVDEDGDVDMAGPGAYAPDLDDPMLLRMAGMSIVDPGPSRIQDVDGPMSMDHIEPMDVDNVEKPVVKKRASVKEKKQAVVVTMVHGDVVVLSGDTFDYSIKRFGTSICESWFLTGLCSAYGIDGGGPSRVERTIV
ncbi:hypothetical protein FPV67DRAFT_1477162 [Lyophyllum atratum]|nr:hypothetical protein FPV67DRAFT_1477162 [Lyophyllum atratum]